LLIYETYPSGRVVKNSFEADGDLLKVESQRAGTTLMKPYVSNFSYTASGGISQMRLGNGNWESTQFNNRFQPVQIGLGNASNNTTNLWKVNYEYGELQADGTTVDANKNNGNIAKQIITVPTINGQSGFVAAQVYGYDSLNRLKQAKETVAGQTNWQQTFSYDRFGNRNLDEANTTTLPKACLENSLPVVCAADRKSLNPAINQANNRLTTADGYEYDANGNTTKDAAGRRFTYDALNKQKLVKDAGNQPLGDYIYDGDGKRIKKLGVTENTLFVYDGFGSLIAEYAITSPPPNPAPNVSYLTTDTLGSPRIVTGKNGEVLSRRDFLPFGEEIAASESNRKVALGYTYGNANTTRQAFTGYEKDTETDLEFAQNRYYSNKLGRFTSVDPLMASGKARTPQTWNRYIYVRNNPLNLTDPSGLCPPEDDIPCDGDGNPTIPETVVTVGINEDNAVTVTIGEYSLPPKVKGKTIWQHIKSFLGFDTGTGTPTLPAPPTTIPVPTNPEKPSPSDPNAPDPGGDKDTDNIRVPSGFSLDHAIALIYVMGRVAYDLWVQQTEADREALPDNTVVVRGGETPTFPRLRRISGAMGENLRDAGRGVRNGSLWWTTAGQIRQGGGRVWLDPEPAYPNGPTNYRHASIILGITKGGFRGSVKNPAPKNERPPQDPNKKKK
jgi:RHS repeat-associated protein